MPTQQDIENARHWIAKNCHRADIKSVLERGLEYCHAVTRAGLCLNATDGECLYDFLSDVSAAAARREAFVEPTL